MFKRITALAAISIGMTAGTAHADPTPNFIPGTPDNDLLVGTRHNDFILARRGNDVLVGWQGNDILRGGGGDDTLRDWRPAGPGQNHSGHDLFRGGPGNDRCIGDAGDEFRGCEDIIIRGS